MFGDHDPKEMPKHLFSRARRVDYSTAQKADISKQNYSVCPRHWYLDATIHCGDCKREFVFTASEQRYWYENRRFYVDSFPTRCAKCRRHERTKLEHRQRYDAMIESALARNAPPDQKRQVVAIIDELELIEGEIPEKLKQNRERLLAQLASK